MKPETTKTANDTVRAAIDYISKADQLYWESMLKNKTGQTGSVFVGISCDELECRLKNADWVEYYDDEIRVGCIAFTAKLGIPMLMGILELAKLANSEISISLNDMHGTGKLAAYVNYNHEVKSFLDMSKTDFATIILGKSEEVWEVWTVHPDRPIRPTELKIDDTDSRKVSVQVAIGLGFKNAQIIWELSDSEFEELMKAGA